MEAAIFEGPGKPLRVESVDDPMPGDDDLILAVSACGICGSDVCLAGADGPRGARRASPEPARSTP